MSDHEGDSFEELVGRMTAEMDQALAGLGDAAKILHALQASLQDEGFTEDQAFALVTIFWTTQLTLGSIGGSEE